MANYGMLAPAAALVLWSMIMLVWGLADRAKVFKKAGIDFNKAPPGARGSDIQAQLPPGSDWPMHNYVHLMEQPTAFYALAIILSLAGGSPYDVGLAWLYVVLRVIHSVWQAKFNNVPIRAAIFTLASLVLLIIATRAFFITVL